MPGQVQWVCSQPLALLAAAPQPRANFKPSPAPMQGFSAGAIVMRGGLTGFAN